MFPSAKYAYQTVGCHFIVEMFVFVYDIKYLLMIMLIRFKQIVATNNFKNNCGATLTPLKLSASGKNLKWAFCPQYIIFERCRVKQVYR